MTVRNETAASYTVSPIGKIVREDKRLGLQIYDEFRAALLGLEGFTHGQVLFWFDQYDMPECRSMLQVEPPYDAPITGVFANRSPVRPNLIGLSTVKIRSVDMSTGLVLIADIDAFDGTPILDIKPYIPCCDRVANPRVPEWASEWPEWLAEDGLGLE